MFTWRGVVCMFVCVLSTRATCAKTAKPIEMLFGERQTHVGPKNLVLDGRIIETAYRERHVLHRTFGRLLAP